jgi:hypothetical protein
VRAQPTKREGHLRKNWHHEGRTHDYFDTGMMYFSLVNIAAVVLDEKEFRHNKAGFLTLAREAAMEADDVADVEAAQSSGVGFVGNRAFF